MIFKGLTEKFKRISGAKYLKQELPKPREIIKKSGREKRVGIILDLDKFSNPEQFSDLNKLLNLPPNSLFLIGYRRSNSRESSFSTPIFSDRDLGWNGVVENSNAVEFTDREYDLLLNFYNENNLLMQLVSIRSKARLRVGFEGVDPDFNDLILLLDPSDFELFKSELKKYLTILTKWN
jgi:hypothetical protein